MAAQTWRSDLENVKIQRKRLKVQRRAVYRLKEDLDDEDEPAKKEELQNRLVNTTTERDHLYRAYQDERVALWQKALHLPEIERKLGERLLGVSVPAEVGQLLEHRQIDDYEIETPPLSQNTSRGRKVSRATFRGQPAILKEFPLDHGSELRKLSRELRMYCELRHPCIAEVCAAFVGEAKGYIHFKPYKRNLAQWIQDPPHDLSCSSVLRLMRLMLDGLRYIHSKDKVHADISPSNICISFEGDPVFIDFELSRTDPSRSKGMTTTVTVVMGGTDSFTAPELKTAGHRDASKKPTHATDVFSMGTVLQHLLDAKGDAVKNALGFAHAKKISELVKRMVATKQSERPSASRGYEEIYEVEVQESARETFESRMRRVNEIVEKAHTDMERMRRELTGEGLLPPWRQQRGIIPAQNTLRLVLERLLRVCGAGDENVVQAWCLEDNRVWLRYAARRKDIMMQIGGRDVRPSRVAQKMQNMWDDCDLGGVHRKVNEVFLFHGSKLEAVSGILPHGFNEKHSRDRGLFGNGVYFAEDTEKALDYTEPISVSELPFDMTPPEGGWRVGEREIKKVVLIIVARVVMGSFLDVAGPDRALVDACFEWSGARREPIGLIEDRKLPVKGWDTQGKFHRHHCLLAAQGMTHHREIVVQDGAQGYPAYIVALECS
eukprot:Hpha_TRINITY_DN16802_c1_g3::TRINITY_DN16802_c1_g3_i1::g.151037::m.151037